MAEEKALVDSGAMENFIDHQTVKRLKIGTKKLKDPIPVRNIDGTQNRSGHIVEFLELIIARGGKKVPARFYVTNLGGDRVILGYPWLRDFNPKIDWPTGKLEGPAVTIETCFYSRFPTLRKIMAQRQNKTIPTLDHPSDDMKARAAAIETMTKDTPTPEDMSRLPKEYIAFSPIFAKPVAGQLPPHRPWDLKVRLIPNAPLSLSCQPYQLSRPEQIFQRQYIKENLARGFI